MHCWYCMLKRQSCKVLGTTIEESVCSNHQPTSLQLGRLRKDSFDFGFSAGIQDMKLQFESPPGHLEAFCNDVEIYSIGRVNKYRKTWTEGSTHAAIPDPSE